MGNASSSFKRNADKDELLADFELLDMVKVEDSRRYFSTKFDYHNHLLSFFQFDDVYLSWFGVRSHRHFKCFGVEIVSALDLFIVGYLLCSAKLLSFNERLEYAMAFFQFPTASDEGSDGSADRIQTRANVRKDEVMLFIETAACAFSRLASINLVEQQYVISIIDQIFGTEQFKPWEQVKVQIMMNQDIIGFLHPFSEILNWPWLAQISKTCLDLVEKQFVHLLLMKSINDEEERKKDEETNKHAIHPPANSKSSKNKSIKARQRKNNGDQELNVNNTQKSANKLDFATCANIIERVINSFPFMKSLQLNEIEVLIFIFSIFGNLVTKETFMKVCNSILAYSLIDLSKQNKIYPKNIVELRDLTIGDYTTLTNVEKELTLDDIDSEKIRDPPKIVIRIPSKTIDVDGEIVSKDTALILVAKLDLQLSSTSPNCPKKGLELYGKENVFYVTRMGWVEFHCNLFGKVGVDIVLLKTFQRLDSDNRGGLTATQCAVLVRERFAACQQVGLITHTGKRSHTMSKALTKIIDENVEYIISQFIESTESSPGLSRWEEIQKYAPELDQNLISLRNYMKILQEHDEKCPEYIFQAKTLDSA